MSEADRRSSSRSKELVDYKLLDSVGKGSPAKSKVSGKDAGAIPKVGSASLPPKSPLLTTGNKPTSTLSFISDSLNDTPPACKSPDNEKVFLQRKLQEFEEKTARLREKQEIDLLRQQVQEKERDYLELEKALSSKTTKKSSASTSSKKGTSTTIDINSLRDMPELRKQANKQLRKYGLVESSDSSSSESSGSSSVDSEAESDVHFSSASVKSKNKHKKQNKKSSGLTAKASESIKNRQRFPHAHLRFDFASKNLSFDKLDIKLFVAGELEIIAASKTGNLEKKGRLELLKKLMYLSCSYEVSEIKSLYAAVLREIELGHLNWGEDFQYVESAVLAKNKNKVKSSSESFQFRPKPGYNLPKEGSSFSASDEKIWYCPKFQSNKCSHKSSHIINVKGKSKFAKHLCATCYLTDKKELAHPECSSACPHQN